MKKTVKERAKLDDILDDGYGLDGISCTYTQGADCNDLSGSVQVIKLETVSNGVASYINISLPDGGHWSISDIEDFIELLKDFKSRFEYRANNEK